MTPEHSNKFRMLRESFVPVILVFLALFSLLLYVYFKAEFEAQKITVIDVGNGTSEKTAMLDSAPENSQLEPVVLGAQGDPAVALMQDKQWQDAEKLYLERLKANAGSEELSALGRLYLNKGDLLKAQNYLDRAVKETPTVVAAYFNRALLHVRTGQLDAALADYEAASRINPKHYESRYNAGMLLLSMKQPAKAISAFEQCVNNSSGANKMKGLLGLGDALQQLGELPRARSAFEEAIRIQPNAIEPRFLLAELLADTDGEKVQALKMLQAILELSPDYPPALVSIAGIQASRRKPLDAEKYYRRAIQFDPLFERAHLGLGALLIKEKRWPEASIEYKWLLDRDPERADAYFDLGRIAFGQKKYDESISQYQTAIKMRKEGYPEAWLNLGLVYSAMKDYPAALKAYSTALEYRRQYPEAWYNIGIALLRQKKFIESEKAFNSAVRLQPDYEQAWFNLGVIYSDTDRDQLAIDAYEKALKLRPSYSRAKLNLAVRYSRVGNRDKAIQLYRELLDEDDSYALAWSNLGLLYRLSDQTEEAVTAYRKLVALQPTDAQSLYKLGSALRKDNQTDEAVLRLKEAVNAEQGDTRIRLELVRALHQAGLRDEAQNELNKIRQLDPNTNGLKEVELDLKKN